MNKYIVVTGATKGIGLAIVELFASKDYEIAFCSRNEQELQLLQQKLMQAYPGKKFIYQVCDVSDKQQVKRFGEYVKEHFLTVDILVNNAGVFIPGSIALEGEGVFEQQMNTNVSSAYHLTRELIPAMYDSKKAHIFNICSTASFVPYINGGSYCISKFALLGMTKVLREEMKDKGVRVTAVMPGPTLTESWSGTDLPESRFVGAMDVADQILHIYELPKSTVVEELVIRPQLGDIG